MNYVLCMLNKGNPKENSRGVLTMKYKYIIPIFLFMVWMLPLKSFGTTQVDRQGAITRAHMIQDEAVIDAKIQNLKERVDEEYGDHVFDGDAKNFKDALDANNAEQILKYSEPALTHAREIYSKAQDIKRLVDAYNTLYFKDASAASKYSETKVSQLFMDAGYVESGNAVYLGFYGAGDFTLDFTKQDLSRSSDLSRHKSGGTVGSGSQHRGHRRVSDEDEDEDSDSDSGKRKRDKKDKTDCDQRSGVETFFDNLMPWVGVVGGGLAAYSNYGLKKDMLETGERLMNTAISRGNSPYMYMPIMQSAMNYDPFGPTLESTLVPSLMAMTELHNRSNGNQSGKASGSEFARYYANKFRMQRMMEMAQQARAQGNTSSSSNSNFNYTFQKAIEGLKGLDRAFVPMDQMLDQMERRMGSISQEMNGGMSSRQRQELLNVVSNLSNGIKSQEMFNKNMSMIFDQMRMLVGQAKESARNQEGLINGQGGVTTTVSGSNSDVFNSQWNRVGNPGVPWMNSGPAGPVYGGGQAGGQVMYRGPGGQIYLGVGR